MMVGSGFGYRAGAWQLGAAFRILFAAAWIALAGAVLSVVAAIATRPGLARRGFVLALVGAVGGALAFGIMVRWRMIAGRVPPIHDITTDTANPPPFVAILPLRAGAPNPAEYGGTDVASAQKAAYPDIVPVILPGPPGTAYRRALATANDMGWQIVAEDSAAGRIEATATTRWFGFKDDVVIRITPAPAGGRVDVRSVSRVGKSDVGTNAHRIREFEERLTRAT